MNLCEAEVSGTAYKHAGLAFFENCITFKPSRTQKEHGQSTKEQSCGSLIE
jgi:hypothetical protein